MLYAVRYQVSDSNIFKLYACFGNTALHVGRTTNTIAFFFFKKGLVALSDDHTYEQIKREIFQQ